MTVKVAVTLSLNADLVDRATSAGLDLASLVETTLRTVLRDVEGNTWEADSRAALESFNRYVDAHGPVGESERRYG